MMKDGYWGLANELATTELFWSMIVMMVFLAIFVIMFFAYLMRGFVPHFWTAKGRLKYYEEALESYKKAVDENAKRIIEVVESFQQIYANDKFINENSETYLEGRDLAICAASMEKRTSDILAWNHSEEESIVKILEEKAREYTELKEEQDTLMRQISELEEKRNNILDRHPRLRSV